MVKEFRFSILLFLISIQVYGQKNKFIVQPYLQYVTENSIHILWESKEPSNTIVSYREAQLNTVDSGFCYQVKDTELANFHEIKLSDLKPSTTYFWQVSSSNLKDTLVSEVYSFQTARKESEAFLFALIGDSQRGHDEGAWNRIANLVWEDRPNFIVHSGDLVSDGNEKSDWTDYFFPEAGGLLIRVPMFSILGNHENDASFYYHYFSNPSPEYYYKFSYGNAEFFMIDTNREVSKDSEIYNWLEASLAASTAQWKFVIQHHPPYTSEENDNGDTYKEASTYGSEEVFELIPLFEKYNVDFCFYGHVHMYERTWPIKQGKVNMEGVRYINSGGAGGNLEHFAPTRPWFSLEQQSVHHYCTFAIFEDHLIFKAIDENAHVFDSFEYTKAANKKGTKPAPPRIISDFPTFKDSIDVSLQAYDSISKIYYRLDRDSNFKQYRSSLKINQSVALEVFTQKGNDSSRVVIKNFLKASYLPGIEHSEEERLKQGWKYKYYEGNWTKIPDFDSLQARSNGITTSIDLDKIAKREDYWGAVFNGYLRITDDQLYKFFTSSDDGSRLYIDDNLVVDNDGDHSYSTSYGAVHLGLGLHSIRIEYFDSYSKNILEAGYYKAGKELKFSGNDIFYFIKN